MTDRTDVNSFLGFVKSSVDNYRKDELEQLLQIEPPRDAPYDELQDDLVKSYPSSGRTRPNAKLRKKCQDILQQGHPWQTLPDVVLAYLEFLRREKEFNEQLEDNLADIREGLREILRQCVLALSDTTYGVLILPFTLRVGKILTRVSVGLDKRPELITRTNPTRNGFEGTEKVTLVEDCANLIRDAFIKCLADKTGTSGLQGAGRKSRPENKRTGIYTTANLCLKLLLQCDKLRNAEMMFTSIDAQSPPLAFYPAAQRVSFLYYLGRYHFANNHFFRAQASLQAAYDQCHVQALKHRRLIITYLIASNVCLGRFPSVKLLSREEATNQASRWTMLCQMISRGDTGGLQRYLSLSSETSKWFLRRHLLLQLQNRCEVLSWRSLVRRTFIVVGYHGGEDKTVPFLRLSELRTAASWLEKRHVLDKDSVNEQQGGLFGQEQAPLQSNQQEHDEFNYVDKDFSELDEAIMETGFDMEHGVYGVEEHPNENGFASSLLEDAPRSLDLDETESIVCSLIQQGLLKGFVTHSNPRFAIPGAKSRGPLATGFPNVWRQIVSASSDETPGWVKDE